jgi:ferritin-like metal-binding protein YciE
MNANNRLNVLRDQIVSSYNEERNVAVGIARLLRETDDISLTAALDAERETSRTQYERLEGLLRILDNSLFARQSKEKLLKALAALEEKFRRIEARQLFGASEHSLARRKSLAAGDLEAVRVLCGAGVLV